MPFFRPEEMKSHHLNPHLSSGEGPIVEGAYMYWRINIKRAGTGSELHYHPNELMTFPLTGKMSAVVGKERRIVHPGTFVHVPPCARHSFRATEDGELRYIYVKDRTWTLIGSAADEALPDAAPSAKEVARAHAEGKWPGREKTPEKSQAIVDGLGCCYYPLIEGLDAPAVSGHTEQWIEGRKLAFGFIESPPGYDSEEQVSPREMFAYVIRGELAAEVDGEAKVAEPGDLIHVPKGKRYGWRVAGRQNARYAIVRTTPHVEKEIDRTGAADNWRG
jgi:quercetin dioxygenase-like cupin family protein